MRPRLEDYESLSANVRRLLWVVDRIGYGLFGDPGARRLLPVDPDRIRRILVMRCDGLGDAVCSGPAIRALRKRFPDARIDWMVGPWAREIAELLPGYDRLLVHAPWGYRALRAQRQNPGRREDGNWRRSVRAEKYDLAVDLRGDLLSLWPLWFWRIPVRVARVTRGGGFTVTHPIGVPAVHRLHEVRRALDVVSTVGASTEDESLALNLDEPLLERAATILADAGAEPSRTILIAPGAQWRWRCWPKFGAFARLAAREGWRPAVVGSAGDRPLFAEIAEEEPSTLDLTGRLSLKELAGAFARTAGFVAVDSGPAHIAAAAGARGVVLFGPGNSEQFGPFSPKVRLIHERCPNHPCDQRGDCRTPDRWCMARIEPDRIYRELTSMLRP